MNLKELVKKDESETLEFKKSLSEWKEIIETISAFSNTKGGTIVVGIDNKGKVHGVAMGKNTIEDLTNKILTNTEPKIYPAITLLSVENKNVIVIRVEKFPYDVVLAFGRPFKRVGRSTVKMSNDEYKKRILEIHKRELYFDGQTCNEADFSHIDPQKVKEFVRKARSRRKLNLEENLSEEEILKKLKLVKGNKLTNACVLLFGKNPQDFFTQASVKCIRFRGTDVATDMLDFKDIEGDLFSQVAEVENFIFRNIGLKA